MPSENTKSPDQTEETIQAILRRNAAFTSGDAQKIREHLLAGCRNESEKEDVRSRSDKDLLHFADVARIGTATEQELRSPKTHVVFDDLDKNHCVIDLDGSLGINVQRINGKWY